MKMFRAKYKSDRRGVSSIEFALACPTMLLLFCGLADFGLALWDKSMLANAVAQGAYYSFLSGTSVSSTTVKTFVQGASKLSGVTANVTGPACYCMTGFPAALATATCGSTCSDSTIAGYYVQITATYTYSSILPAYSTLNNPTLTEKTIVRLQ